jgi:hypothetical protein
MNETGRRESNELQSAGLVKEQEALKQRRKTVSVTGLGSPWELTKTRRSRIINHQTDSDHYT